MLRRGRRALTSRQTTWRNPGGSSDRALELSEPHRAPGRAGPQGAVQGSVLGSLWSLLNPAATLAIYSLVFGAFLRIEPPVAGNGELKNFALYLFCALVMWNFFSQVVRGSQEALTGAGPLLKKVYFPPSAPR